MVTTLYVGSDKEYATINAAIDAARSIDGEVIIEIAAGVYDEYVHLETALLQEKSLTFQGETDSLVVMKGGLEIGDYGQNKNITKDLKFCNIKFEANPGADNNYNATAEDDKKKVQINNAGSPAGGSITFDNCSFYAVDKDGNRGDAYIDEAYILVQQRNAHGNGYFCNVKYNECDFSNGRISFYMGNGGNEFIGCTFNNAPINDQTGNYKYTDCVFNADLSKIADGSDYYVVRINRDSSNSDIFDGAVFNVSNSGNVDFTEIKTDNIIWIRSQESITTEAVLKNVTINGLDADNMAGVNPFGNTLCNGDKTASWNGEEEKIFVRGLVVDGFESEDDIKALLARTSGVLHAVVGNKYYIYNDGEFASAADISTIFVDAAYTEDNVGEGKVFGVNAFDSFTAALEFAQLGVKEIKINGELTDNVQAITSNVQVAKEAVVSGKVVVGHFGFYGEKITDDGKMSATLEVQGTVNAKNTSYFWVGETYGAEFADGTRFVLDVNGGTVNDTTETGLNLRSSGSVKVWNGGKFFTRAIVNEGGDILVSGKDSLVTASIEGGDVVNLLAGSLTIEDEGKVQIAGPWGGLTFKVGNDVEVSITSNGVLEFLNGKNNLINNGTITVNGGKLLADNVTNNGTFTVSGESTLNIASLTGNALSVVGTTTLTDSTIGGNVYAGYSYTNDADLTIKGSFNANILIIGNKSENYTDGTVHTLNINTGDKVAEFGTLNIRTTTDASIENSTVKSGDLFVRGSLEVSDSTLDQNTTIKGGTGHWAVYENGDSTKTASLVIKNSTLTNTSSAKAINYLIVGSNSNGESNADSNAYVSLENSSLAVNTLYLQGAEAFQENYVELTDGSSITTNKIWIGDYASLSVTDSEVTATNVTNNGTFTVAGSSLVKVDSGSGSVDLRGTLLAGSKIKGMALHIDDFASEIQTNADTATEVGSICINYNNADAVKDATLTVNGGGILNSGAVYLGWADKKADFIVSGTGTQVNMGMFLNFYNSSVTIKEGAVVKSNSAAVYGDFKVDGATYTASVDGFGISDRYSQYYESDGIELSITNKATFNTSRLGVGNWYYNGPGDALWNGATIIVDNSTVNASGVILNNYTDDAKVSAVIKLSNGAVVKANSAVVNGNGGYTFYLGARNELKMDVTSSIETNKFEGSGVITVDAAGFTETAKLIDASAWSFTGDINVDINVMAADSKVDTLVFNNDLYITDADKSTLYVSSAYADAEVGDIVDGKIIGYNAFSDVADAIGKMDDSTLKIAVSGEISSKWLNQSGQDAFNSPYDKTIDYALNFEKAEDAESAVIDATENSDWVSYVFTKDVTVGEGVTLQLYDYEANQKTWDNFINFAPVDDTLTMTVNGTLIYSGGNFGAGSGINSSWADTQGKQVNIVVSETGRMFANGSSNNTFYESSTLTVTGTGKENLQFSAGSFTQFGGKVTFSETNVRIWGDSILNYPTDVWMNLGNDTFTGEGKLTATNTRIDVVDGISRGDANDDYTSTNNPTYADLAELKWNMVSFNKESDLYNTDIYAGDMYIKGNTVTMKGGSINLSANKYKTEVYSIKDTDGKLDIAAGATLTVDGSTEYGAASITAKEVVNNGTFTVSGESTLNIASLTGDVEVLDGSILKNSNVGGNIFVAGGVTFRGDNTFAMIYDYGTLSDVYETSANMSWKVEAGASVEITGIPKPANGIKYGLGYGDNVTIYGELTDARASYNAGLSKKDASFIAAGGINASTNAGYASTITYFTVKDAYVRNGIDYASDQNFRNDKTSNYGTYHFSFDNSVFETAATSFVDSEGIYNFTLSNKSVFKSGNFSFLNDNSKFAVNASDMVLTANATSAASISLENNAAVYSSASFSNSGTVTVNGSSFTSSSVDNDGTFTVSGESTVKVDSFTGALKFADAVLSSDSAITFSDDTVTVEGGLTFQWNDITGVKTWSVNGTVNITDVQLPYTGSVAVIAGAGLSTDTLTINGSKIVNDQIVVNGIYYDVTSENDTWSISQVVVDEGEEVPVYEEMVLTVGATVQSAGYNFKFSASATGGDTGTEGYTFVYKVGGEVLTGDTWQLTDNTVKNFNVTVTVYDMFGESTAESSTFTVNVNDETAPVLGAVSADVTDATNGNVIVSIADATDNFGGSVTIEYSKDGGETWDVYVSSGVTFETNGTVQFRATDAAGNVSAISEYTVTNIDKDAPTLKIAASETTATNKDVILTATVSDGTVEYFNGTKWVAGNEFTVGQNGTYQFRVTDAVGNVTTGEYTVTNIDKEVPVLGAITITPDAATNGSVTVSVAGPADATVEYSIDGGTNWIAGTSVEVSDNNTTVQFRATDAAGNVSAISKYTVDNIDKVVPELGAITASTAAATNGSVTVSIADATDNFGGSVTIEYSKDGGETWDVYVSSGVTFETNGTVQFRATDAAGNVSAISEYTVSNIDKVAPEFTDARFELVGDHVVASWSVDDSDAKVLLFVDGKEVADVTGKTAYEFKSGVFGKFELIAYDAAGNEVSASKVINLGGSGSGDTETEAEPAKKINITAKTSDEEIDALADSYVIMAAGKSDIKIQSGSAKEPAKVTAQGFGKAEGEKTANDINNVTVGNYTELKVLDNIANAGNIKVGNEAVIRILADNANATLKGVDANQTFQAGKNSIFTVNGHVDLGKGNDTIKTGENTVLAANDLILGEGNDKITTGKAGQTFAADINFGEGKNTLQIGNDADLKAVSVIFGAGNGNDTFKAGNGADVDIAGDVTFGAGKNTLQLGKDVDFDAAAVTFGIGNDTFKAGNGAAVDISDIDFGEGKNTLQLGNNAEFSAESVKFGAGNGNDTFKAGNGADVDIAGAVSFGDGNNKFEFGKDVEVDIAGDVTFGAGNDTFKAGNGADIELWNADSKAFVDLLMGAGNDKFIVGDNAFIDLGCVKMGDGNDTLQIGKKSTFYTDDITFGAGNDKFIIGDNTEAEVYGALDMGDGKDTLTIKKDATLYAESLTGVETINASKGAELWTDEQVNFKDVKGSWKNLEIFEYIDELGKGELYGNENDVFKIESGSIVIDKVSEGIMVEFSVDREGIVWDEIEIGKEYGTDTVIRVSATDLAYNEKKEYTISTTTIA